MSIGLLFTSITLASGGLLRAARAQDLGASWALRGATLIDGTAAKPVANSVVTGSAERITCAGRAEDCPIPPGAAILDLVGKWLIPGLIDTHIHPNPVDREKETRQQQLRRFAFGTTATRDAGTPGALEANLAARKTADTPAVPEPRLVVSGLISAANLDAYGAGNLRVLVRKLISLGADAIKIKQKHDATELAIIVGDAHAAGLPVFGHTYFSKDPQSYADVALAAGIDGLSHMDTVSAYSRRQGPEPTPVPEGLAYWIWLKQLWLDGNDSRHEALIDSMIRQKAWLEPTLVTEEHFTLPYPLPDELAYLAGVPSLELFVRSWLPFGDRGIRASHDRRAIIGSVFDRICGFVRRFQARGGTLITGTDDEQPGAALIDEIRLLERCGVPPQAALRAATGNAAKALNRDDIGMVRSGRLADLVILDADPLSELTHLRRIWRVVKGGHLHDPEALLRPTVESYRAAWWQTWVVRVAGLLLGLVVFFAIRRNLRSRQLG